MATANTREMVGDINERGITWSLINRGFTIPMAVGEFIANSIDADANIIKLNSLPQGQKIFDLYNFAISDDGNGMTWDKLKNCASLHGMNHTDEKKIGLAGTGLKTAGAFMSKKQTVLSRSEEGEYLALVFPWEYMLQHNKYSGKVELRNQTTEEIAVFVQNLPEKCRKGTVILMDLHNPGEVNDYINYIANPNDNSFKISDLPQVRFGQCGAAINILTPQLKENTSIRMFNPYDYKEEYHYACKELPISLYTKTVDSTRGLRPLFAVECIDGPGSIVYFEGDNKVNQNARVLKNTDFEKKIKNEKWQHQDHLNIGLRLSRPKFKGAKIKDDYNGSSLNPILNSEVFPNLDEKCIRPLQENMQLVYNNMVITLLPTSGNNFRANGDANVTRVNCAITVTANSDRTNRTLQKFGINDNKMLHSGELPKALIRLAKYLRAQYHKSFSPFSEKLEKKANDSKCKADTVHEVKKIENIAVTKINEEAVLPNQEQPIIDTHQDKCVKPDGFNTKLESKLNASQSNHEGINENDSQGIYANDRTKNNDIPTSICDISEKKHTIVQNEAEGLNIEPQGKAENDQLLKEILDKLEPQPKVEKQLYEILKRKFNPEDQEETY